MNNFETGEKLIPLAERSLDAARRDFEERYWNLTIRRAQEALELALKAVLKTMGVEYPKEHHVGGLFQRACKERELGISAETLDEITHVSSRLAAWRSPAFYAEEEYDEQQARWALGGVEKALQLARELMPRLRGQE